MLLLGLIILLLVEEKLHLGRRNILPIRHRHGAEIRHQIKQNFTAVGAVFHAAHVDSLAFTVHRDHRQLHRHSCFCRKTDRMPLYFAAVGVVSPVAGDVEFILQRISAAIGKYPAEIRR